MILSLSTFLHTSTSRAKIHSYHRIERNPLEVHRYGHLRSSSPLECWYRLWRNETELLIQTQHVDFPATFGDPAID